MIVTMHITLRSLLIVAGLGVPGLVSGKAAKTEKSPYEPMQVIRTIEVLYPQRLSRDFIDEGSANVAILVGDEGRLMDWMVMGYSHPLFAKEVLEVLPKWKFVPAYHQGKPIYSRAELRFVFKNSEIVRILPVDTGHTSRLNLAQRNNKEAFWSFVCRQEELDQPLDAIVEISPMSPDRLGATAKEGKVIVEYLIDAEGKVRMPIILSADDEAFAQSVLLAINEWRYVVPRHGGMPVITFVRRQFTFSRVNS